MIPPVVFAIVHLSILAAICVALGISAMPSRMARSRHRGVRYRRLSSDEMVKRLRGGKRLNGRPPRL